MIRVLSKYGDEQFFGKTSMEWWLKTASEESRLFAKA